MNTQKIALAAGGTGGHFFPAEAVALELVTRGHDVMLITDPRGGKFSQFLERVKTCRIKASKPGSGIFSKIKTVLFLAWGTVESFFILKKYRPRVVIGFGGYPSVAPLLAARLLGIPFILHEQNAVLSRANRLFVPWAKVVATSFPVVQKIGSKPVVLTGNPVRAGFSYVPYVFPEADGPIHLFITGGSQGATILSQIVPAALGLLPENLRKRLHIAHQARAEDVPMAQEAYEKAGISAQVQAFYTNMPQQFAKSHLVICRSGASTMAELAVMGRPSLLVPLPTSMDNHQAVNAQNFVDRGAAWMMLQKDLTPERLAEKLRSLFEQPALLAEAAQAARSLAHTQAAARLADLIEQ